ncbi:MAG: hypothetical protein ACRDBQ_22110 [Shewanella sp.]
MTLINKLSGKVEAKKKLKENGFVIKAVARNPSEYSFEQVERITTLERLSEIGAEAYRRSGVKGKVRYFENRD